MCEHKFSSGNGREELESEIYVEKLKFASFEPGRVDAMNVSSLASYF